MSVNLLDRLIVNLIVAEDVLERVPLYLGRIAHEALHPVLDSVPMHFLFAQVPPVIENDVLFSLVAEAHRILVE